MTTHVPEPQVQFITTTEQFQALQADWDGLFARAPNSRYFQSFAWNWHAWKHLAELRRYRLCIVCVQERGRTVLILPLVVRKWLLWNVATALCNCSAEYSDALVEPHDRAPTWVDFALNRLAEEPRISALRLRHLRDDAHLTTAVANGRFATSRGARTRIIGVDWRQTSSWDEYCNSLGANLRREQRRSRKRLSNHGPWGIEEITVGDMPAAVEWTLRHKRLSLSAKGQRNGIVAHPDFERFLLSVVLDAHRHGHLSMYRLHVAGSTIAVSISFRTAGHSDGWICTFDPAWGHYSPGNVLLEHMLQNSCETSPEIDFGPGGHAYKLRWGRTEHACWNYALALRRWGRCYAALWGIKWGSDPVRKATWNCFRRWIPPTSGNRSSKNGSPESNQDAGSDNQLESITASKG